MVLINGVKYACERCIRGHRVTTCTHTDQPLMMIKPKGRPSTSCEHCKNARKTKNQHQKCLCSNRVSGQPHENGCPCNYDDSCTCQKTVHKKKTSTVHTPLKKQNSLKQKQQQQQQQQLLDNSDYSLLQRSNIHNLENNNNSTDNFQAFDMSLSGSMSSDLSNIPSNSHSNSVASSLNMLGPSRGGGIVPDFLSDNNRSNNSNNNYNNNAAGTGIDDILTPLTSPTTRAGENSEYGQQASIGMDCLNDFKPTTSQTNFSRVGEVSVPIDEYVQPLQQMTDNLNNLLSGSIKKKEVEEEEIADIDRIRREKFFGDIPVPFSGNGLLDIFQDNSIMSSLNDSSASVNTTSSAPLKFKSKSPTALSELSPASTGGSRFPPSSATTTAATTTAATTTTGVTGTPGHSLTNSSSSDLMFPMFQANGNISSAPLSPAGSSSSTPDIQHQTLPQQQQSPVPHHLHHHYHQLPPHHSNHQHAHYQSHFSPYPLTKRSESFLSSASSVTSMSDSHLLQRPPVNQSSDSLVSLQQQQTLTNDNYNDLSNLSNMNNSTPSPTMLNGGERNTPAHFDSFDLFDGDSIDSFLNKTDFNV